MAISYKDFRAHSFEATGGAVTGTKRARPHPESLLLIFHWPPVLAWLRDATVTEALAMLKLVPFWQGWPPGRPGPELRPM